MALSRWAKRPLTAMVSIESHVQQLWPHVFATSFKLAASYSVKSEPKANLVSAKPHKCACTQVMLHHGCMGVWVYGRRGRRRLRQ